MYQISKFNIGLKRAVFFSKLLQAKLLRKSVPLIVTLSLTPRCNFNCAYCYGDYQHRQKPEMTKIEIFKLLKELKKAGTDYLQLSGGEPLIRKDIEEIVDYANELGFCLGINTNGSLISQKPEVIKKIGTVTISFDGQQKENDKNRGKGTFKKITKAIDLALTLGVNVHTYTTVTKHNLSSLPYILKFAKERKITTEFGFLVSRNLKNDKDYQGLDLSPLEFKNAIKTLIKYKKNGYPILFSQKVLEKILKWPDFSQKTWENKKPNFSYIKCFAPQNMIFIDCDGKVYPCLQFLGQFQALDFRKSGFQKAYQKAHEHECQACYLPCVNDLNLMFNLDFQALWNNASLSIKEIK
jgi:MoaA/NifB/PqqE/SkfB family radical SAM enzyme